VANVFTGILSSNGSNIQVKNNKIIKLAPKGMLVSFENNGTNAAEVSSYAMNN
jgi:hypothetical protein